METPTQSDQTFLKEVIKNRQGQKIRIINHNQHIKSSYFTAIYTIMDKNILYTAIQAALAAGAEIMSVYTDPKADFEIEKKRIILR